MSLTRTSDPSLASLQDDVVELRRLAQTAHSPDAELIHLAGGRRRLTETSRGDLHVLLAQRIHHVAGGEIASGQAIRVEPQPHRILPFAENRDVADAGDTFEGVLDVDVDVVAQKQRVVLTLWCKNTDGHDEAGRLLLNGDAVGPHFDGQTSKRLVHAVLNVDLRQVLIARDVERDVDRRNTVVGARRGHVEHALDAIDRLLERRRDRGFNLLGVGTRVERRDVDLRRRQRRVLRDGHRRDGDQPGQDQHERTDRGEDRTADERVDHEGGYSALIGAPSPTFCTPATMMRSPGFRPLRTT